MTKRRFCATMKKSSLIFGVVSRLRLVLTVSAIASICLASNLLFAQSVRAQSSIIFNESFEGEFASDASPAAANYCKSGNCNVPEQWNVWFIPRRDSDQQGINFQPKFVKADAASGRVRGGGAQRIYEENKTFTAGIYRVVQNVQVGSKLRFSTYGQIWSTRDESPISARPSSGIKLKVGIDPFGGIDGQPRPLSNQVIWSTEQEASAGYITFTVEAEAKSANIIVYTYATMRDPVRHNEVFWDDAVLEYIAAAPVSTPALADTAAPAPAAAEVAAPAPKPTPADVTHVVDSGDTLSGLAVKYNTTVEEIKRLNNLDNDLLSIGQILIVVPAQPVPTVTIGPTPFPPTPDPAVAIAAAMGITDPSTITQTGQLCVAPFFDDDGSGKRDASEDYVPDIDFVLTINGVTVGTYKSDGKSEPHCFLSLPQTSYTIAANMPSSYVATSPLNDTARIIGGARTFFYVGMRRTSDGLTDMSKTPTPSGDAARTVNNAFGFLATVGGVLLVLGAVGFVASLFLRRRQL